MTRRVWLAVAFVAACGKPADRAPGATSGAGSAAAAGSAGSAAAAPAEPGWHCVPLPFAPSTPVPEASGAAWITVGDRPMLLVIGDSGNAGAYGLVDPDTGATVETGKLPLSDDVGDDLEGLAARGDRIYGVTSSGWIEVWQRQGRGFARLGAPYPLGRADLSDRKHRPPAAGDGMACSSGRATNCGRDYEGLCLAPAPRTPDCIGVVASKADGRAYCLSEDDGKLVAHHDRSIAVTGPRALADCALGDDGALWLGSNLFDLGRVYRVTAWDDPPHARVEAVGALAIGFPETLAVRGDVVYRMSDMGGSPSAMARWRCTR